jgi:hypothetical protein
MDNKCTNMEYIAILEWQIAKAAIIYVPMIFLQPIIGCVDPIYLDNRFMNSTADCLQLHVTN